MRAPGLPKNLTRATRRDEPRYRFQGTPSATGTTWPTTRGKAAGMRRSKFSSSPCHTGGLLAY
jgi:hypothetical protein